GNSNLGALTGVGGLGTGTSAQVGNRTALHLAKPDYADSNSEGTVLVAIQVSASGAVISASVTSSTTSSAALKNAALVAAKKSRFSEGDKTESGTITYRFKLR
ncbi:MAG: energy transducer TonB, partial [Bacteroidaceae bacterium]|nr:energy transducer TonB [Bacteroidaceae bacterium]